jgi:hypothetical protein
MSKRILKYAVIAFLAIVMSYGVLRAQPAAPQCTGEETKLLYPYVDTLTKNFNTYLVISNITNVQGPPQSGKCTVSYMPNSGAAFTIPTSQIAFGGTYLINVSLFQKPAFIGFAVADCCFASATGVAYGGNGAGLGFSYTAQELTASAPGAGAGGFCPDNETVLRADDNHDSCVRGCGTDYACSEQCDIPWRNCLKFCRDCPQ